VILINLLLKPQMHAKTYFFLFSMLYETTIIFFLSLRNLVKTKYFFSYIYIFAMILRKPSILKPKLYFYKKIQTTKWIRNKTINLSLFVFWPESSSVHVAGLDPASLTKSLAQANEPAGPSRHAWNVHRRLLQEEVNYKLRCTVPM
jgi:hypothetical protein